MKFLLKKNIVARKKQKQATGNNLNIFGAIAKYFQVMSESQLKLQQLLWKSLSSTAVIWLVFFSAQAVEALQIERRYADTAPGADVTFFMDDDENIPIRGMYLPYAITNDTGTTINDTWVKIDLPAFGSGSDITLGQFEDGLFYIGSLAPGETKTAFFYGHTARNLSSQNKEVSVNDSHNVIVYDGDPGLAGATQIDTQNFTFTRIWDTQSASPNKVSSVSSSQEGEILTVVVNGDTGNIGQSTDMVFNPAVYADWPADSLELIGMNISFAATGETFDDRTFFQVAVGFDRSTYVATYRFRVKSVPTGSANISPVAQISSGQPIKHTDTSNFGDLGLELPPIQDPSASNADIILVKRITAINGDRTKNPNDNTTLNQFVDDTSSSQQDNDNSPNWPDNYLIGAINAGKVKPGDEIEYTVYFLNAGSEDGENLRICDRITPNQDFKLDAYGAGNDLQLKLDTKSEINLTSANDSSDRAQLIPTTGSVPANCNLKATNDNGTLEIDITGTGNTTQSDLTIVPGSTGKGTPDNSYGFIRFTTTVKP